MTLVVGLGAQHVFQIVTKDRVWVMFADSAVEADAWVKQLSSTIAGIPEVRLTAVVVVVVVVGGAAAANSCFF